MMHYKISNLFGYSETSVTEISTSREVNLMVDDEGTTVYVSLANVNPDTIKVTKNMEEDDFLRISVTGSVMAKADKDSNKLGSFILKSFLSSSLRILKAYSFKVFVVSIFRSFLVVEVMTNLSVSKNLCFKSLNS